MVICPLFYFLPIPRQVIKIAQSSFENGRHWPVPWARGISGGRQRGGKKPKGPGLAAPGHEGASWAKGRPKRPDQPRQARRFCLGRNHRPAGAPGPRAPSPEPGLASTPCPPPSPGARLLLRRRARRMGPLRVPGPRVARALRCCRTCMPGAPGSTPVSRTAMSTPRPSYSG